MQVLFRRDKNDHGFSLLEVLIAVVILGFVGIVILNSIQSNESLSRKNSEKLLNFNYMTAAAEMVAKEAFVTCNGNISNPYPQLDISLRNNKNPVKVTLVEGQVPEGGGWKPCGDPYWATVTRTPMLQRITLYNEQVKDPSLATRKVFKNLLKINSGFTVRAGRSVAEIDCNSPISSFDIAVGFSQVFQLAACSGSTKITTGVTFFTPPGSGLQINGSGSCSAAELSNGTDLTMKLSSNSFVLCPPLTGYVEPGSSQKRNIEIAAIENSTGQYYNPSTLNIVSYYPPTVSPTPAVTPVINELQHSIYGSTGRFWCDTSISINSPFRFSATENNNLCSSMPISYQWGVPGQPVTYDAPLSVSPAPAVTLSPSFALQPTSTTPGGISFTPVWPTPVPTPSSNQYSLTINLKGGGIPSGSTRTGRFNLEMHYPLNVIPTPTPTFSPVWGNLGNSSSTTSLLFTVKSYVGTGLGPLPSASPTPTSLLHFNSGRSGTLTFSNTSGGMTTTRVSLVNVSETFDRVLWQWTYTLKLTYSKGNSTACGNPASGQTTASLKIYDPFLQSLSSASVYSAVLKCT